MQTSLYVLLINHFECSNEAIDKNYLYHVLPWNYLSLLPSCICRFIYLFIGVGAILFIISCCGCVGAVTRNGCCLTCVSKSPYISLRNAVMCLYSIFDVAYPLGITMVQPLYAPQPAY